MNATGRPGLKSWSKGLRKRIHVYSGQFSDFLVDLVPTFTPLTLTNNIDAAFDDAGYHVPRPACHFALHGSRCADSGLPNSLTRSASRSRDAVAQYAAERRRPSSQRCQHALSIGHGYADIVSSFIIKPSSVANPMLQVRHVSGLTCHR